MPVPKISLRARPLTTESALISLDFRYILEGYNYAK